SLSAAFELETKYDSAQPRIFQFLKKSLPLSSPRSLVELSLQMPFTSAARPRPANVSAKTAARTSLPLGRRSFMRALLPLVCTGSAHQTQPLCQRLLAQKLHDRQRGVRGLAAPERHAGGAA